MCEAADRLCKAATNNNNNIVFDPSQRQQCCALTDSLPTIFCGPSTLFPSNVITDWGCCDELTKYSSVTLEVLFTNHNSRKAPQGLLDSNPMLCNNVEQKHLPPLPQTSPRPSSLLSVLFNVLCPKIRRVGRFCCQVGCHKKKAASFPDKRESIR